MADLAAVFRKPFKHQVAAFRIRAGNRVPTARWDDLIGAQHDRAFVVAGALKADLLADLAGAVGKAIEEGTTLDQFRRDFQGIVEARGWHGWTGEGTSKGEAWRTRVIYRTNMATSYAAGRRAQLVEGGFKYWVYRHGGSLEPRLHHLALDGLVLPADHPFWTWFFPPNDWGCSCRVFGARTLAGARRLGGDPDKRLPDGWDRIDPRTGAPAGIGKGWGYAPGATVSGDIPPLVRAIARVPARLGAQLAPRIADPVQRAWEDWLARKGDSTPAFVGPLSEMVVSALAAAGAEPASAEVWIRPGIVKGPKARRHEARGDGLRDTDWQLVPAMLRSPRAILRDERTGRFLFLAPATDGTAQLALDLDYSLRVERETRRVTTIVSAYLAREEGLSGRLRGGLLTLIFGAIGR